MSKQDIGLYRKFHSIIRGDGQSEPGKKHHDCDYFVLDITHDPFAVPALFAYAKACEKEYPLLANDLRRKGLAKSGQVCPQCNSGSGIIYPRGHIVYCEDCGWPDEDFDDPPGVEK